MARRTFDVVDVTEILIHWHAGRSISEVSTSLDVDRKTVRYAARGITDVMPTRWLCRAMRRTLPRRGWGARVRGITGRVVIGY
jgi:hypothetical protein